MNALPRIPGFEVTGYLGGGPMTAVYSALDLSSESACALKLVREDWEDQPTAVKLLQREARAGLSVRHPSLVRIVEAGVTRPPYFLVMELLPGESLECRLQRLYQLDVPTTLWIARQTAEALAALHRAGFVHGDVKPANIRLVTEGRAVLIDLGFAHRPGENAWLLADGYLLGTADYLAPELCTSEPDADQRSDLFSLGVTLFEMLTGQLPFPRGSLHQTLRRHGCDPPADVRYVLPQLSAGLGTVVNRLLAHRPGDRPNALAVVRQLISLEIATMGRRSA
jgi:serine/threonine protein kinase